MAVLKIYSDLLNDLYGATNAAVTDFSANLGTVDTVVMMAEKRIFREIRCREMEQTLTTTITIASGVLSLPADYVELIRARLSNESPSVVLTKRTPEWIYERFPLRSAAGRPRFIAREGGRFIFGPYPDTSTTYTLAGMYFGRPDTVIGQTTTASMNAVFSAHPDLYLAATVVEARNYLKLAPELVAWWEQKFQMIKKDLAYEVNAEVYEGSEIIGDE